MNASEGKKVRGYLQSLISSKIGLQLGSNWTLVCLEPQGFRRVLERPTLDSSSSNSCQKAEGDKLKAMPPTNQWSQTIVVLLVRQPLATD